MQALTYLLHLIEPLLATQTTSGEPNSATAANFLPGSLIRGALLNQRVPPGQNAETDAAAWRLFFGGALRFLNAYPAWFGPDNTFGRLFPVPRSFRALDGMVYDLAVDRPLDMPRVGRLDRHKKTSFVRLGGAAPEQVEADGPHWQLAVHNASDDRNRKQATLSQVFRYEALAEGEYFAGTILGAPEDLAELANALQPGAEWLLGGSRLAGYGLVRVEQVVQGESEEYTAGTHPGNGNVILTLLSDAIVLDGQGRFSGTLDPIVGAQAVQTFAEQKVVGGFNRHWGLPYPQAWAIAAGSVFVYPAERLSAAMLETLRTDGIGERRIDGLGRVAVNWHTRPTWHLALVSPAARAPQSDATASSLLTGETAALVQRTVERLLRSQLEAALAGAVAQITFSHPLPRPAQLSRVRLAARQALFTKSLDPLRVHLNGLFDTAGPPDAHQRGRAKVGARQLEDARLQLSSSVPPMSLLDWLDGLAGDSDAEVNVGLALGVDLAASIPWAGQEHSLPAERRRALKVEFAARLMDAVLKSVTQQAKRELEIVPGGHHA